MREGTRSLLVGSHSVVFHTLAICRAWRAHYGRWPQPWQFVCITLHDVGLWGMDYLSGPKDGHWKQGALIAGRLFGAKGFRFCAGHSRASGYRQSDLLLPDKLCWLHQPKWLLEVYHMVEGFTTHYGWTVDRWLASVRERARDGFREDAHAVFLREKEQPE